MRITYRTYDITYRTTHWYKNIHCDQDEADMLLTGTKHWTLTTVATISESTFFYTQWVSLDHS